MARRTFLGLAGRACSASARQRRGAKLRRCTRRPTTEVFDKSMPPTPDASAVRGKDVVAEWARLRDGQQTPIVLGTAYHANRAFESLPPWREAESLRRYWRAPRRFASRSDPGRAERPGGRRRSSEFQREDRWASASRPLPRTGRASRRCAFEAKAGAVSWARGRRECRADCAAVGTKRLRRRRNLGDLRRSDFGDCCRRPTPARRRLSELRQLERIACRPSTRRSRR